MNKARLYTSELNLVAIISNNLVHKVPKSITLRQMQSEIRHISAKLGLSRLETNKLWLVANKMYLSVSKRVFSKLAKIGYKKIKEEGYTETLKLRQNTVYSVQKKLWIYSGELEKVKNDVYSSVEHREKHDGLRQMLDNTRASDRYSPFFLASAHQKCAKDHQDSEGKLFFDEYWRDYVPDADEQARILRIIKDRKLQSIQYITGAPVLLGVRKNCKHYFIPVSIDEIKHAGNKKLLKEHDAYMPDEKPLSYETQRYRVYYDRLKALQYLKKVCPSPDLDKDILDTRRLASIWGSRARNKAK